MFLDQFEPPYIPSVYAAQATSNRARSYLRHGIPQRFWPRPNKPPRFYTLHTALRTSANNTTVDKTFPRATQDEFWSHVRAKKGRYILSFGGSPTDHTALEAAFELLKEFLHAGMQGYAIDINTPYAPTEIPDVLLLYNVTFESVSQAQINFIRGCLYSYSSALRLVVVAGDPYRFMLEKLHVRFNGLFYLRDKQILEF